MKEIKTRDTVKDIRMLDSAANVADRMKNAYIHTRGQAEQMQQADADSPAGYAEKNLQDMTRETGHVLQQQGKHLAEKMRQKINVLCTPENTPEPGQPKAKASQATASSRETPIPGNTPTSYNERGRAFVHNSARLRSERIPSNYAGEETRQGVKTVEHGMNQNGGPSGKAVRTSARDSIKTVQRGIKTAEQIPHVAVNTTKMTEKTATKTVLAAARTAQKAVQMARSTARVTSVVVKTASKAATAAINAMVATVKSLIVAIAAAGWVAVVIIVVVLVTASILCSVFGLFASEEGYDSAPSMPEVVRQINTEYSAEFDAIIKSNPHDRLVIDNASSASIVANWDEVLAIYAVLVATDPESPTEVATLDDAKIEKLKMVFWDMNIISYSVDEVQVGTDEKTGGLITETVLTIIVSYRPVEDMIAYYGFNAERAAQVRELLQPEYAELFASILGPVFGIFALVKSYDGSPSLPEVVSKIHAEFSARLNPLSKPISRQIGN